MKTEHRRMRECIRAEGRRVRLAFLRAWKNWPRDIENIDWARRQKMYTVLYTDKLYKSWRNVNGKATGGKRRVLRKAVTAADAFDMWLEENAMELASNLVAVEKEALADALIAYTEDPVLHARLVRESINLHPRQVEAIRKRIERALARGYSQREVDRMEAVWVHEALNYRATSISQTEIARAFNAGREIAIKEEIEEGLVDNVVAEWSTAEDELVCEICGPLNGRIAAVGEDFDGYSPPAHPWCRCVILYRSE